MGVFDFLVKKKSETIIDVETEVEETFIEHAQKAARIVDESLKNGEIAEVSDKLKEYTNAGKGHAVFESMSITPCVFMMLFSILFSLGFLLFLPVAVGTALYSTEYRQLGLYGTGIIVAVLMLNAFLCIGSIREIRFLKRYAHYQNILKYRKIEIIDDLAGMIGVSHKVVEKDLRKAVKMKLIPQGHFGQDNMIFFVTDEVFTRYSTSRDAYDRHFKKLLEDRSRTKDLTKETKDLLSQGEEYIGKIRDCNDIIKDKEVSEKLDRMEKVVSAIFHEVDINPSQADKLGVFINYYLPATEKLLESYLDIDKNQSKGGSLLKEQRDITQAIDSINNVFESLLERFYEEQELDVVSDITSTKNILKLETLQTKADIDTSINVDEEHLTNAPYTEEDKYTREIIKEDVLEMPHISYGSKEPTKPIIIAPVPYAYADLPKEKMNNVEYVMAENKVKISRQALTVLQVEGPILKGVLIRRILASFGVNRNAATLEATENALKESKVKTTKYKGSVFCWAPDQDPKTYYGLRVTNDRSIVEICPQELCNAAVYVLQKKRELPKDDLVKAISVVLGYKRIGKNMEAVLTEGIQFFESAGVIVSNGRAYKLPYMLSDEE